MNLTYLNPQKIMIIFLTRFYRFAGRLVPLQTGGYHTIIINHYMM